MANYDGPKPALQLSRFAVAALFFIAALHGAACLLTDLLNKKRCLTLGTGLIDRSIPQSEFTLRVSTARVEVSPLFRALLYQIPAAFRLRAFHSQSNRFGRFTFRIGGTG